MKREELGIEKEMSFDETQNYDAVRISASNISKLCQTKCDFRSYFCISLHNSLATASAISPK